MTAEEYYATFNQRGGELAQIESELRSDGAQAPSSAVREDALALADELSAMQRRLRALVARATDEVVAAGPNGAAHLRVHTRPVRVGALSIDPARREVRVGERIVQLANKEFALLQALATEPTRVFTKHELLDAVWGYRVDARRPLPTRTLDSHASRLRRKLDPEGLRFVRNAWGVGYRLVDLAQA